MGSSFIRNTLLAIGLSACSLACSGDASPASTTPNSEAARTEIAPALATKSDQSTAIPKSTPTPIPSAAPDLTDTLVPPTAAPTPPSRPANVVFDNSPGNAVEIATIIGQKFIDLETEILRADLLYTATVVIVNDGGTLSGSPLRLEVYRDSVAPENILGIQFFYRVHPGRDRELSVMIKINSSGTHKIIAFLPDSGATLQTIVDVEPAPTKVTVPHPSFEIDKYYSKYLDSGGISVFAPPEVEDKALEVAASIIETMLVDAKPDIRPKIIDLRIVIFPRNKNLTDLPYLARAAGLTPSERKQWEGFAGVTLGATVAIGEKFLIDQFGSQLDNNSFYHEFAHGIIKGLTITEVRIIDWLYFSDLEKTLSPTNCI